MYLDHAATTPLDAAVLAAMMPYLTQHYGNPSSIHAPGRQALQALDDARELVAEVLGALREEIVFTSGGSEANNLALRGVAQAQRAAGRGKHIITSAIEHHSVLHVAEHLRSEGFDLTLLPVDAGGRIHPAALRDALRSDTVLVSLMYANNEIGTIQPIAELGALCRAHGVPLHTDAVQAAGLLPLNVEALQVDLLSLAAHKFYGPRGAGALYVRRTTPLHPQILGGEQERRRRAGTENVAALVGQGVALHMAEQQRQAYAEHCTRLRDRLIDGILERIPHTWLNGDRHQRLPNHVNIGFDGIESESLVLLLDSHGIAVGSGSACNSGMVEPSHVLLALGLSPQRANSAVRMSLGRDVRAADIDALLDLLPTLVAQERAVGAAARDTTSG